MLLGIGYFFKNQIAVNLPNGGLKDFLIGLPELSSFVKKDETAVSTDTVSESTVNTSAPVETNTIDMTQFDSGSTIEYANDYPHLVYASDKSDTDYRVTDSGANNMQWQAVEKYQHFTTQTTVHHELTSGYRNEGYNKIVGGSSTSDHLNGTAFDIKIATSDLMQAVKDLLACGFTRIGFYSWGIHAASNPSKNDAFWCDESVYSTVQAFDFLKEFQTQILVYRSNGAKDWIEI